MDHHTPAPATQAATDQATAAARDGDRNATMDALRALVATAPPGDLEAMRQVMRDTGS